MVRAPYIVGPPVRQPTDFFGREQQTRQFYETLDGAQAQCVSVLGLRRAGKTSFLQHVSHPQVMAANLAAPQRYVMVCLDVSTCRTPADFYSTVFQRLLGALPGRATANRSRVVADVFNLESLLYEFGDRRVVLLMDEFDHLKTADFSSDFLAELRALAGVWDYELAYVTSSYWELDRIGNFIGLPSTSPFYNIFYPTPIYLSGLNATELEHLVRVPAQRVGIEADEEDVAFVRYHAGSIPFFVQALAAIRLTHKTRNLPLDMRDVTQRLVSEMWPYFEQWWSGFSDVEREVLTAVVQEKGIDNLPYNKRELAAAVQRLTRYGMLNQTGDQVWADSRLFSEWLLEYSGRAQTGVKGFSAVPAFPAGGAIAKQGLDRGQATVESILQRLAETDPFIPIEASLSGDGPLRDYFVGATQGIIGKTATVEPIDSGSDKANFLIRLENAQSVLAACSLWRGQKALLQTVDQLIAQRHTEPDHRVVLIPVKANQLSLVFGAIVQALPHHVAYMGKGKSVPNRRLTFKFRVADKRNVPVSLSVLLFKLAG